MEQETVRPAGKKAGTLTIFAGYFSGTGKTYAMLRASCTEEELNHFYKVLRSYNQIRRQQT